jgi:hypothetical protein
MIAEQTAMDAVANRPSLVTIPAPLVGRTVHEMMMRPPRLPVAGKPREVTGG